MLAEEVFILPNTLTPHPVLEVLLGDRPGARFETDPLKARLILIDARAGGLVMMEEGSGGPSQILESGRPLLILSPSAADLAALRSRVGVVPATAQQAILIWSRVNPSGVRDFDVAALSHGGVPAGETLVVSSSDAAKSQASEGPPEETCLCDAFSAEERDAALDRFMVAVEQWAHEEEYTPSPGPFSEPIPTGLKYFQHLVSLSAPFRYSVGGAKQRSDGSFDARLTVWGFLYQSESENRQYLIVEASYTLNPGQLIGNGSKGRGFGDITLSGRITPPLDRIDHQPLDGQDSWSAQVKIPISYRSPLGGFQIWNFDDTLAQSIGKWSVRENSSGAGLGSFWFVNSPFDGSNLSGDWRKGFTFWGHVKDLPGASTGSVTAKAISAWFTSNLIRGSADVATDYEWTGARLFSTSCSPGLCFKLHSTSSRFSWQPGFSVDMTPINPS